MKHLAILMDMHGRLGPIEGAVEGLLAQNREYLTRLKALEVKLDTLASENRQWRRHVERLMRQKEALLESHGVRALEGSLDRDDARELKFWRASNKPEGWISRLRERAGYDPTFAGIPSQSFSDYCQTQR